MRFSVFTPTHDPKFLGRLADSLAAQTFRDFEWVVVPNNGATIPLVSHNPVIATFPPGPTTIGALKSFACAACRGDVLVEVDHDDELTPDCLAELAKAFDDPTVDFAYSNCCEVVNERQPYTFNAKFGWENRPFIYRGAEHFETIAFAPTPAAFAKIWYAPNHVRAWRKSFYQRIGPHNQTMDYLDDQELLCRTYIEGKVVHIDKCLYIYHRHTGNACFGERNSKIQTGTLDLHDRFIYQLVERWCDLNGLRKIDLCSGPRAPDGYEGVDMQPDVSAITADLNDRWPFEDESIGVFRAHDAIEHLRNPIHTMKEAYRCLAPNGWLLTFTPSTDGRGAFQDPTHVSFWNSNSFWYYTRAAQAQYIGTPVRFQASRLKDYFPGKWYEQHNIPYVKADLLKFSGRVPGLIEI